MTIEISKKIFDYFRNSNKLIVSVNKISEYFSLSRLKENNIEISFNNIELVSIEIDENELDSSILKDENVFSLMAIYAMGVGE
ncbi:MAG: hypothetical protein LBQ46_05080 [Treponema sp.]|jgi:uncharacterized protein YkuJ|nr:hypothetical protein [Treponema sp.]